MNKTCYFYWDASPMALLQTFGVISFHKYNPDWGIVVCVTRQRDQFKPNTYTRTYTGPDYFHLIANLDYVEIREIDIRDYDLPTDASTVLATDLFRMRILYREGGVYSDHDVIWLKPMSVFNGIEHLGNMKDFDCMACYYGYTTGHHNVSIMMAEKGSRFLKTIIDAQNIVRGKYTDQCWSAELFNRMFPSWDVLKNQFPRMLAVKYETFYPYSTFDLSPLFKQDDLSVLNDNVMAVHWFAGNILSNEFMNEDSLTRSCSITTILKNEGYI